MSSDDPKQDRDSLLFSALARLEEEQHRAVGLAAQSVMLAERAQRLNAANAQLDARARQQFDEVLSRFSRAMERMAESRSAALARMTPEEVAAVLPKPTIDAARRMLKEAEDSGRAIVPRRRDDSITLSVEIPVDASRKKAKKLAKELLKLAAVGVGTWLLKHWGLLP